MDADDLLTIARDSKCRKMAIHPTAYLEIFGNHPNGVTMEVDDRLVWVMPAFHIKNLNQNQAITDTEENLK
jgi:hypothetical protein